MLACLAGVGASLANRCVGADIIVRSNTVTHLSNSVMLPEISSQVARTACQPISACLAGIEASAADCTSPIIIAFKTRTGGDGRSEIGT